MSKDPPPPESPAPKRGLFRGVRGFFRTIVLVAVILYGAALLMSRTDGFRSIVAERIHKITGLRVEITGSHLTPRLDLVLNELRIMPTNGLASLASVCQRVEVHWSLSGEGDPCRIYMDSPELHVLKVEQVWGPKPLSDIVGELARCLGLTIGVSTSAVPAQRIALPIYVRISHGKVAFWDSGAAPVALIGGLQIETTPVPVSERLLTHVLIAADDVSGPGIAKPGKRRFELIDAGDAQFVLGPPPQWDADSVAPLKPST